MIDPKFLGHRFEPRSIEVERGQLRLFAKAAGETDPVYSDLEAAKAAGHRDLPAPPTFLFSLNSLAPAETFWLDDLQVELAKVLHAEQAFDYRRLVYAGDTITFESRIADLYDKKGGLLEFAVQEVEARNQAGELCATLNTTLVVRHG